MFHRHPHVDAPQQRTAEQLGTELLYIMLLIPFYATLLFVLLYIMNLCCGCCFGADEEGWDRGEDGERNEWDIDDDEDEGVDEDVVGGEMMSLLAP